MKALHFGGRKIYEKEMKKLVDNGMGMEVI